MIIRHETTARGRSLIIYLLSALYGVGLPAVAAETEIVPLSFGRFVLADNSTSSTVTIRINGNNPLYSNNAYPIEFGNAGEYLLSGLPAFTPLDITVAGVSLTTGGPQESLSIGSFTYNDVTTDSNGEGTLFVGATLTSSGNGNAYVSTDYNGTITITINF